MHDLLGSSTESAEVVYSMGIVSGFAIHPRKTCIEFEVVFYSSKQPEVQYNQRNLVHFCEVVAMLL